MTEETRLEIYKYLVKLRNSGATNMWGAVPYLERKFPSLEYNELKDLHINWFESFSLPQEQQPKDGR